MPKLDKTPYGDGQMLAVLGSGAVDLYRKVGHRVVFWRRVTGAPGEIQAAVEAARALDLMAAGIGGWANALRLGLDPAKPIKSAGRASGIFLQNELDCRLGKL